MKIKSASFNNFLLINGALCLIFMLVFKPVIFGDAPAYINLARQLFDLPGTYGFDLSHRSPLYSMLLGIMMLIFGQNNFTIPVMILQYLMVFLTSILIYRIFYVLTGKERISFFAGLFSTLNFSTIFFAYNILSEILSLFILTLIVYEVIMYYSKGGKVYLILAGFLSGFIVLARFNALGIPLILLGLVLLIHFSENGFHRFRKLLSELAIVTIGSLLVLNLWALYNYQNRGFYNIFPAQHAGQRWAIPSTINENNVVTDQYKEVLRIFLNAKKQLSKETGDEKLKKASLLNIPLIRKANDYFRPATNGFFLYSKAKPDLLNYYNLSYSSENINILGKKLKHFYNEIAIQNRRELLRLKIYSFLYTFKYVSPTLPANIPININMLPALVIKTYKFLFLFSSVFVFILSLIHSFRIIFRNEIINNYKWLVLYAFILYFPVINFYANVLADANRFKFPSESIMLGLFVYFGSQFINRIREKIVTPAKVV